MSFPYEILLRGENGIFKGGHLIEGPFDAPVKLTVENLRELIGVEMATILTRNIELEKEIEKAREAMNEHIASVPVAEKAWWNFWSK